MAESWTPTAQQVHDVIPTRNGGAAFDDSSQPTADQVESYADMVSGEILAEVGVLPDIDAADARTQRIHDTATRAAVFGAGALVEWGGFPEQNNYETGEPNRGSGLFSRHRHNVELLKAQLAAYRSSKRARPGTVHMSSPFVTAPPPILRP